MGVLHSLLLWLSRSAQIGHALMRPAIAVVFILIDAAKFAPYEADSIMPSVANNTVLWQFYRHPKQYRAHLKRERELVPAQRANPTYGFSDWLGMVAIMIGFLVLTGLVSTPVGAAGALLPFPTSMVTLSVLVTTPEAWVPPLGDAQHGLPYLSGAGRLVAKDVMLLAGVFLLMVQSAKPQGARSRLARATDRQQSRPHWAAFIQ